VRIDENYLRPTEVEFLQADTSKARQKLGWEPTTTYTEMVGLMLESDLAEVGLSLATVGASGTAHSSQLDTSP
jgi:GDPmannose 4,6-dehydratase